MYLMDDFDMEKNNDFIYKYICGKIINESIANQIGGGENDSRITGYNCHFHDIALHTYDVNKMSEKTLK